MRVFVHHALASAYDDVTLADVHKQISSLRQNKNDTEVAALQHAIKLSETALTQTVADVRVGMSETDVESLLIQNLFSCGAEDFAFRPIVAAGDNSARPHAKARDSYKLKTGDALLIDFGGRYNGLNADITRTFFIEEASEEQQAVYATVLEANQRGHAVACPGATPHDVDDTVTAILEASPFRDRIRTKTGHGLGRDIHEDPYIMRGNHATLEPGMVFTIEPGLYDPDNFGVRIEDDVLITDTGMRSLTSFSRELTILG